MNNLLIKIGFILTLSIVLIGITAVPAAAEDTWDYDGFPLTTKTQGTVNGGVFINYGDNDQMENAKVKPYVTNFSVPNGTPVWAKLYMHLWGGNPNNGGTVNVTFNNHDFETVLIEGKDTSDSHVLGSGCGTWWIFFNVTDHITPGDINQAEVSVTSESMDGRIARIVLVEVYEDGDDPQNVMYWVNDGHMNLHYNSSDYPWCLDYAKTWFNGTVPSGVTEANLTGIWLTGSYGEPDYFYFNPPDASDAPNGSNLNWNISNYSDYQLGAHDQWTGLMSYNDVAMGGGYYNNYFDIHSNTATNTSMMTNILKDDNNYAIFWRGHDDNDDGWIYGAFGGGSGFEGEGYVHAVLAALVLKIEGEDVTPPYTDGHDPAPGAVNIPVDANITVHIKDSSAGVNESTILMKVNNISVTPDITGTPADYELVYDPPVDFGCGETVNVSIDACDLNDNCMQYAWEFTTASSTIQPDLVITEINAFHYDPAQNVWFNLSNEVNITVVNIGSANAGTFNVSLYANDEFIGKQAVSGVQTGSLKILQFSWTPAGCDCEDGCLPLNYILRAVADCDNNITESNETNNESTANETVYWNGYMNDESLEIIAHGTIRGGLHYTTGDGAYAALYTPQSSTTIQYNITLPEFDTNVELARLNVYYIWNNGTNTHPEMEINLTNSSGTYVLTLDASYNDTPCSGLTADYSYGNYVYDVTPYITISGNYTVVVKNNGTYSPEPTSNFSIVAPGLVMLYKDNTRPEREYWLIEGADLLEGGRRSASGSLALYECINNATFTGNLDTVRMENATLGIVCPWGGEANGEYTSYYWFNDYYLGSSSILGGYSSLYEKTVDGISMYVGASGNAQIGVNVSEVNDCITAQNNVVGFGDDGDSIIAANAFFIVEYSEQTGECGDVDGENGVTIGDGILVAMYTIYGPDNYSLANPWAADVDCENGITIGDGIQIAMSTIYGTEQYPLECCVQCGDVDGENGVTMEDAMQVAMYTIYGAEQYPLTYPWAADVDCANEITMGDAIQIGNSVTYGTEQYPLECCSL